MNVYENKVESLLNSFEYCKLKSTEPPLYDHTYPVIEMVEKVGHLKNKKTNKYMKVVLCIFNIKFQGNTEIDLIEAQNKLISYYYNEITDNGEDIYFKLLDDKLYKVVNTSPNNRKNLTLLEIFSEFYELV